jgi:essential nuclear protein 1
LLYGVPGRLPVLEKMLLSCCRDGEAPLPEGLDDQVVAVYRGVGALMARYSGSGKVPKAFKIIPSLHNWEEVLYLTDPDKWSPHAM